MLLTEDQVIERLDGATRVVLLEPKYRRKYPPIGLAKIAAYLRQRGTPFEFTRSFEGQPCDLVCVTSLFTTDLGDVLSAVHRVQHFAPDTEVMLGGICASLFSGKLSKRFNVFHGYSTRLDRYVPDYETDWGIESPWDEFSYTFTTRGCPNHCTYCAVKRIECEPWVNPGWREHVFVPGKPCAMVSDNNLSAAPEAHRNELLEALAASGKGVVFDNGFDCKLIDDDMAGRLARIKYVRAGLRIAFDRIEEDGVFQDSIRRLVAAGAKPTDVTSYVLYNFTDTPREAGYRMRECANLKIRPYPQQFIPLNAKSRTPPHIGKHWTRRLLKAFRYFWLMPGIYTKHDFATWPDLDDPEGQYCLGDEDRAALAE